MYKKYNILVILLLFIAEFVFSQPMVNERQSPRINIVPQPLEVIYGDGLFFLPQNFNIVVDSSFFNSPNEVQFLQTLLSKYDITTEVLFDKSEIKPYHPTIFIEKDTLFSCNEEYAMHIEKNGITLKALNNAGLFYAIQSMQQLIFSVKHKHGFYELPIVTIHDKPYLPFRMLMLDPARYFLTVPELERFIDVMAMYKFNYLHLHLTDDQGWRAEIKSLPQLTSISSVRRETQGNGKVHKGIYTQEQLKYLVQYAAERHIEIIPEISVPGHSIAALAAFPRLSCNQKLLRVATSPLLSDEIFCAGNQQVYDFLEIIIEELASIFPSKYIHLGGTKVPLDNWKKCVECRRTIKKNDLKNEWDLLSYFYQRVDSILVRNGKQAIFWAVNEVPTYPHNSVLCVTDSDAYEKFNAVGYQIILAPEKYAKLDNPQWKGDIPDKDGMMPVSLQDSYNFEPLNVTKNIIGIEAFLWGYYIPNVERAFYMTYPRALALSEVSWSYPINKGWDTFKEKLPAHLNFLLNNGVNYRPPTELYRTED